MTARVAVLVWEENRPWVSALRQKGYSVPWVEEPKNDLHKQIPGVEPDLLVVDMTRQPEKGKWMVSDLATGGHLSSVPVVLVSEKDSASRGLKGKLKTVVVTRPARVVATVKQVLQERT
jgi:DNA-binding response OmpR family regulator